jgi:hypothetical protein
LHPAFIGHHQQTIPQKFSKQPSPELIHHLLQLQATVSYQDKFQAFSANFLFTAISKHQQPHLFTLLLNPENQFISVIYFRQSAADHPAEI